MKPNKRELTKHKLKKEPSELARELAQRRELSTPKKIRQHTKLRDQNRPTDQKPNRKLTKQRLVETTVFEPRRRRVAEDILLGILKTVVMDPRHELVAKEMT